MNTKTALVLCHAPVERTRLPRWKMEKLIHEARQNVARARRDLTTVEATLTRLVNNFNLYYEDNSND